MFNPGLEIGQILKNSEIDEIFKCENKGGIRRSVITNTLVVISNYTQGLYHDKWIGGVLHYTGMGQYGDQDIHWGLNAMLAECDKNGVDVHLFEVIDAGEYIYCGRVELVGKPYDSNQPDKDGKDRKVWIFPIRPVPENDVRKPAMFVFKDMDDYQARGKNADAEYIKLRAEQNKTGKKGPAKTPTPVSVNPPVPPKPAAVVPADIVGKKVKHKAYGEGTVTGISNTIIIIYFDTVGEKKLGYEVCIKNKLIQFV